MKKMKESTQKSGILRMAGTYARIQGMKVALNAIIILVAALGMFLGVYITMSLDLATFAPAKVTYWASLSLLVFIIITLVSAKYVSETWLKGYQSERKVASYLGYALCNKSCATANDLQTGFGNIDHVVLTGETLWCIETKTSFIPKKKFNKVLEHARKSTKYMQEILQQRGHKIDKFRTVIVFAETKYTSTKKYEDVEIMDLETLRKQVEDAVKLASGKEDKQTIKAIWEMASLTDD